MSNLEIHAKRELEAAGLFKKDSDYGGMLGDAVLELVKLFSKQGHSGFSAGLALKAFQKVANFEPLIPLQGTDDEWNEVGNGVFQNNRCSRVFKQKGQAYDIEGKIFREPDGCCFQSSDSRINVTFPYTPKTEYVDVPKEVDETEPT